MGTRVLYCGGYQLPDKNAAAQRVIGIAKGLRELGCEVIFLNSLVGYESKNVVEKSYFGFRCFEYAREAKSDYLFSGKTTLGMVKRVQPDAIIAYNYPAVALNRVNHYCKKGGIKCYADVTEWYDISGRKPVDAIIKGADTFCRMHFVHKKLNGIIAISRYLYDYYEGTVKTVLIPPTIDRKDEKWNCVIPKNKERVTTFVYAGSPSATKERLDRIVNAIGIVEGKKEVQLNVIGITQQQFAEMYKWCDDIPNAVSFFGKVNHQNAVQFVGQSNWTIIVRENSRMVKAGFPTKLVESISCGTPVVANRFSNIYDYLTEDNSICVEDVNNIVEALIEACEKECTVRCDIFDYHNYLNELKMLISCSEK